MNTKDFFDRHQKETEKTADYIDGKKFNTQAGDKKKQIYVVRLLPRIPNKPTELNDGPFYRFWIHYGCGPDGNLGLVCLNTSQEDFKTNKKKCPACSRVNKIIYNPDEYKDTQVDKAKDQKARRRYLFPVYNLRERKEVEYLEVSSTGQQAIADCFYDEEGNFTDHFKNSGSALVIVRTGVRLDSKYTYKIVTKPDYKLTKEDVKTINNSYKHPESAIIRLSHKDFEEIYSHEFETESSSSSKGEDDLMDDEFETETSGKEKSSSKSGSKGRKVNRSSKKDQKKDDEGLDDEFSSDSAPDSASDSDDDGAIDDLEKEIEDLS